MSLQACAMAAMTPLWRASRFAWQHVHRRWGSSVLVPAQRSYRSSTRCVSAASGSDAATPVAPVDIASKFRLFAEQWSPKIVGQINDMHVKVAKVQGDFVWHAHDDTDELFMVTQGTLHIDLKLHGSDGPVDSVTITPGQFYVVPRGVEHKPHCEEEAHIVLLEPAGTLNTEGATQQDTQAAQLTPTEGEWL